MSTYANTAERDAAIAAIKQQCRDLVAGLEDYLPGRVTATAIWMDGVWGDYWYVELDGQPAGDLYYDSCGPVPKGDKLGQLIHRADLAAERETWRDGRCYRCGTHGPVRTTKLPVGWRPTCPTCSA
jgi:hypothetical protein